MSMPETALETSVVELYRSHLVQSERLKSHPLIRHGITGRIEAADPAEGNIGYSAPRDKEAAWIERQRWARAAGIDPAAIATVHQIHGRHVIDISLDQRGQGGPLGSASSGKADAVMTATPGVAVMTLHADCLAIILADPAVPAVCAIHAGWRGTVENVAGAAVDAMIEAYGAVPGRMLALVGPGMRSCCYEVGDEVVAAWRQIAGPDADKALDDGPRRLHFDLAAANMLLLERAGIVTAQIDNQAHCTSCNGDRWFSHRRQGADTGRFGAMAGIAPHGTEEEASWL